jgi:hypothetical protein
MNADEIKYAIERRVTVEPEGITRDDLRNAGCLERVAVLPGEYKERMSYLADVLVQSINNQSVKDDRLRSTVGQMCQALSYMMNSCSWQEGELMDFDYAELQRKLGRFVKSR